MRVAVLTVIIVAVFAVASRGQVTVVRSGDENPVLTIAKATFWGGAAGAMLGGAAVLIVDDNKADVFKWFFVGGVFGGFGFGVYHVLTRDRPSSALLHIDDGGIGLDVPPVRLVRSDLDPARNVRANVTLFALSF